MGIVLFIAIIILHPLGYPLSANCSKLILRSDIFDTISANFSLFLLKLSSSSPICLLSNDLSLNSKTLSNEISTFV